MRIVVDIEDADREFVAESREWSGQVVMLHAPGRAIVGHIVGEVVPHSAVGSGGQGTVIYDITLLEAM